MAGDRDFSASFWPARSRRDLVARISASFWPARSRDLAGISPRSRRDLEISPAKNSPRFSPRSRRDLREISARSRSKFCRGETVIIRLHVKNLPLKYFVHQPKKFIFLTVFKTVMPKLSPICQRFDDKSCKIHVYSHSCRPLQHCFFIRC